MEKSGFTETGDSAVSTGNGVLEAIMDCSMDIIQVFAAVRDESGTVRDFIWTQQNRQALVQNGDVIGKSLLATNPGVRETGIFESMVHVFNSGEMVSREQLYSYEQFDNRWFLQTFARFSDGVVMTTRDITARKSEQAALAQKELELEGSSNKYLTLFNSMDEGYCIIQMMFDEQMRPFNWRYLEVNPAFEKHNGLFNATGKTILELTPDIEQKWMDWYGNVALTGQSIRFEEDSIALNRVFDLYAFPIGDPSEYKVAVLFTNISKRRHAEEALRKSEEKYRSVFTGMDEGFAILELLYENERLVDLIYQDTNPAFIRHVGRDYKGRRRSEIMDEHQEFLFEKYDHIAKTGEDLHFEYQIETLGHQWFQVSVARIGGDGSHHLAVIFRNITERRNAENRQALLLAFNDALRSISDEAGIQAATANLLGRHLQASQCQYGEIKGEELVISEGYGDGVEPMLGQLRYEIFGKKMIDGCRSGEAQVCPDIELEDGYPEEVKQVFRAAGIASFIAIPLVREGLWRAMLGVHSGTARAWTDAEVQLATEIAERTWAAIERARAEKALRASETQLKALLTMRDEFIGIASHELRTPVTSIQVLADLLEERSGNFEDRKSAEMIGKLNDQVNRLTKLIEDLLDISRIEKGKLIYHFEGFNLHGLIRRRVEEIQSTTAHQLLLDMDEPVMVEADPERLMQVLLNLVSNAIRYSAENTAVIIRVRVWQDVATVSVIDKGIGIPQADLSRIFDRFYRVDGPVMNTYPGMGLGLYIVKQIILAHHGTMSVVSEQGVGSDFSFSIPVKRMT